MKPVDPKGTRLPIKIDSTSNGEYEPIPLSERNVEGNRLALERATEYAKRLAVSRRKFLVSSAGAASTLLAFNEVNAAVGNTGAYFDIPKDAALDEDVARTVMQGTEFIFDVHGHFANPTGEWLKKVPPGQSPVLNPTPAIASERFIKDIFLDSDTDMMVLTFIPSMADAEPLTIEEAAATQKIIDDLEGTKRLLIHGRVNPNQAGDIDRMENLAKQYGVVGWKTYTQWGPADNAYYSLQTGLGFELTDERYGIPFVERARAIGIKNICIHKGIPFGRDASYKYARCDDIGKAAKRFPDMNFLVYHAGFDPQNPEQAFAPGAGRDGIDSLVQSLLDNNIAPNSNVYADVGTTWNLFRRNPDTAAHGMGKLLTYCGENNVLWGTDSIWTGSPQDQIQAWRTFQISEPLRAQHAYPEITPQLRAKVFGLNATRPYNISAEEVRLRAANDRIGARRQDYREDPDPLFLTYGPKTRRQFLNLLSWKGGKLGD
ncbi:MAG: amidohydrolase family protein [Longimicrobiales bacterium]